MHHGPWVSDIVPWSAESGASDTVEVQVTCAGLVCGFRVWQTYLSLVCLERWCMSCFKLHVAVLSNT